jgi:amino acid transporter
MLYLHPRYVSIASLGTSFLTTLFSIIAVSVVEWLRHEDDSRVEYYGLFLKESSLTDSKVIATSCTSDISESACTYLRSAKASAVIAILFGAVVTIMSLTQFSRWTTVDGFRFFTTGFMTTLQFVFLLMLVVIYAYFKWELHEDDDINVEYPTGSDTTYAWAYNLMVASTVASFVSACVCFYTSYQMTHRVKRSSEEKMLR